MSGAQPISAYEKPTVGVWRILVFGELSLTPDDDNDDDADRDWYGAWWCDNPAGFRADGEGFIVNVTHWMHLPEVPA